MILAATPLDRFSAELEAVSFEALRDYRIPFALKNSMTPSSCCFFKCNSFRLLRMLYLFANYPAVSA